MAEALQAQYDTAAAAAESTPKEAVVQLKAVIASEPSDTESIKVKEQAIDKLTDVLAKLRDEKALAALFVDLRPLYAQIPKAKTGKIVAIIIRALAEVPDTNDFQVSAVPCPACLLHREVPEVVPVGRGLLKLVDTFALRNSSICCLCKFMVQGILAPWLLPSQPAQTFEQTPNNALLTWHERPGNDQG